MHTYQAETETIIKRMNSKNVISAICPLKALDWTSIVRVDGVVTRRKWMVGMVAWRMGQAPGLRTCCLKYCRQVNRVLRHGVVSSHRILFSNLEFSRQRATRARSLHPALLLFCDTLNTSLLVIFKENFSVHFECSFNTECSVHTECVCTLHQYQNIVCLMLH